MISKAWEIIDYWDSWQLLPEYVSVHTQPQPHNKSLTTLPIHLSKSSCLRSRRLIVTVHRSPVLANRIVTLYRHASTTIRGGCTSTRAIWPVPRCVLPPQNSLKTDHPSFMTFPPSALEVQCPLHQLHPRCSFHRHLVRHVPVPVSRVPEPSRHASQSRAMTWQRTFGGVASWKRGSCRLILIPLCKECQGTESAGPDQSLTRL